MGHGNKQQLLKRKKKEYQCVRKQLKCLTSLSMEGLQIKTALRFYLSNQNSWNKNKTTDAGMDVRKGDYIFSAGGSVNWYIHNGNQSGGSSKSWK